MSVPKLYIVAGCNGAGKTTASYTVLPKMIACKEFVNADEIARGLSPFQPETVAIEAGRIMLHRINELLHQQVDFAFETTLATRSYVHYIQDAKNKGYAITLIYFWLNSQELAIERVKDRVAKGGHHIPEEVIKRRYISGIRNLFELDVPLCDYWMIFDNSNHTLDLVVDGEKNDEENIYNDGLYTKIKNYD